MSTWGWKFSSLSLGTNLFHNFLQRSLHVVLIGSLLGLVRRENLITNRVMNHR